MKKAKKKIKFWIDSIISELNVKSLDILREHRIDESDDFHVQIGKAIGYQEAVLMLESLPSMVDSILEEQR